MNEGRDLELLARFLTAMPGEREAIARVARDVEHWDALFDAAGRHGVAPALRDALAASEVRLPSDVARRQARAQACDDMFQELLARTLQRVLSALSDGGVRAVALKGPLLAERVYGAASRRPTTDLDLLIAPGDVDRAASAIAPLGYALETGAASSYFRRHHHHVHVLHETLPLVELHYHAHRGFGATLRAGELLARAVPYRAAPWDALVLEPEDEFVFLAVHAASHRFERVGWLYDLKLHARVHHGMRWALLAERARAAGFGAVLAFACEALERAFAMGRPWGAAIAPLGDARASAIRATSTPSDNPMLNALARFGFSTLLCDTPSVALSHAARFVALKVAYELPRRVRTSLAGRTAQGAG